MELTYTLEELPEIADILLASNNSKTFLFYGELGVGKTTLIKEMARKLGVDEELSSPSFSIINEHLFNGEKLFHYDFYRLESEEEALDLGIEDYFFSDHWNFIEWPDRINGLLPPNGIRIKLTKNDNGSRTINTMPVN